MSRGQSDPVMESLADVQPDLLTSRTRTIRSRKDLADEPRWALCSPFTPSGHGAHALQPEAIDDPEFREQQVQSIPLKRAAEPNEIAKLAVFLASSQADYVTGAIYVMDGGLMQMVGQGA